MKSIFLEQKYLVIKSETFSEFWFEDNEIANHFQIKCWRESIITKEEE